MLRDQVWLLVLDACLGLALAPALASVHHVLLVLPFLFSSRRVFLCLFPCGVVFFVWAASCTQIFVYIVLRIRARTCVWQSLTA